VANIVVPELGESVVEARIAKWHKKAGDRVSTGEALVELETEKVDVSVAAEGPGVVTSIAHPEGADVKVGEVLAVIADGGEDQAPATKAAAKGAKAAAPVAAAPATPEPAPKATPTARRAAADIGVDLAAVKGSGDSGRVMKADVVGQAAPAPKASAPAPRPIPAPAVAGERREERSRMTKRRATIARRLVEAQRTAAMLTTFNEVDMSGVMGIRERHKDDFRKRWGVNLGYTSFFVKAVVAALKAFPQLNAEIQGDEIVVKHYYDIGIAVGAEGGLVVPVLRDADRMGFAAIESTVKDFAVKAGDGTMTLEDLRGGTFTITNGGVFGSLLSTPILNPPQVGILGLHKISDRPVVVDKQIVIRPIMGLALSYDHRIVDGREAVQFLVTIKSLIEDPGHMLLEV